MNPVYPVYIISKGRWESRLTSKALESMGVPYRIVVEPQERDAYAAVIDPSKVLVLPFSNLGLGSIPARNWVWEHSKAEGHRRHWIMDDNIMWFARLYDHKKIRMASGDCFCITEQFVDRYDNVGIAGLQYEMFAPALQKQSRPFILNTRVYSCILLQNDIPFRWRGRYNEDTDLSLRILKSGMCSVLMVIFLCKKVTTMTMKGGNTDSLYAGTEKGSIEDDGRYKMAKSLKLQHPDIVTIKRKWGRWQHVVDYSRFKRNRLRLKPELQRTDFGSTNEHGMVLKTVNSKG